MNGQQPTGQQRSSWVLLIWPLVVLGVAGLGTWSSGRPDDTVGTQGYARAQIGSIAEDQSSVRLMKRAAPAGTTEGVGGVHTQGLTVPANPPDLRASLKSELKVGDLVEYRTCAMLLASGKANLDANCAKLAAAGAASQTTLQAIEIDSEPTSAWIRWLTLLGAAALLALFCFVIGLGPGELILGADNRYSKSKFQLVVWFGVAAVCYLSILWLRFCYSSNWLLGSVTIPTNLLTLSGLSALTFGGAKAITQSKDNQQAALEAAHPPPTVDQSLRKSVNPGSPSMISDLVHDDLGNADLGDFQMVFITMLAAVTYLVQFVSYLSVLPLHAAVTMPDVDSTMLAIFGLGHGAYLTKKLASGPAGPAAGGPAGGGGGGQGNVVPAPGGGQGNVVPPAGGGQADRRRIGSEA